MEHLSIDDFIRVEEHLSKKLEDACGFYRHIVTKVSETLNKQPLSRDVFQLIHVNARRVVEEIFILDCKLLQRLFPNSVPVIQHAFRIGLTKIAILHELECRILWFSCHSYRINGLMILHGCLSLVLKSNIL